MIATLPALVTSAAAFPLRPFHAYADELKQLAQRVPGVPIPHIEKAHEEGATREAVIHTLTFQDWLWSLKIIFSGLRRPMPLSADALAVERRLRGITAPYDVAWGTLPVWDFWDNGFTLTYVWRDQPQMVLAWEPVP